MRLKETLKRLRNEKGLSLKKFAELCGVAEQTARAWEEGTILPDLECAAKIAETLRISLDMLVYGDVHAGIQAFAADENVPVDIPFGNASYAESLEQEYLQCTEEGLDLEKYGAVFKAAARMPYGAAKEKIADALYTVVAEARPKEGYPYREPSELAKIKNLCEGSAAVPVDGRKLESKIYGAWMGRICGCMLGKTVEGIRTNELDPLLKETKNYPLSRYILRSDMTEEIFAKYKYPLKERIYVGDTDGMPSDDDTNYLVLAQDLIEKCGRDFTAYDVARLWLTAQPKSAYWTAEQVAFSNFVKGLVPPESAAYQNPFREWIGAQIRGDYFGYINPGNPEAAAEMAFRDASISHVKNGIYGEMFASAMIACAAVEQNIEKIIEGGLKHIPKTSRLHERVKSVLAAYRGGMSCEEVFRNVHDVFDEYTLHGWCHVISNAMIVTAALLYGKGDYGKSICLAVGTGYDTDCNGATVGSVLGMRNGIEGIGDEWKAPIGDTLYTEIVGKHKVSISDCVKKTLRHIETGKKGA